MSFLFLSYVDNVLRPPEGGGGGGAEGRVTCFLCFCFGPNHRVCVCVCVASGVAGGSAAVAGERGGVYGSEERRNRLSLEARRGNGGAEALPPGIG